MLDHQAITGFAAHLRGYLRDARRTSLRRGKRRQAAFLPVSALVVAGYALVSRVRDGTVGLTTEIAAVAAFFLGAMTMLGHRELAIGLGVVTAAALAYKQPLHRLVAKLGWDDVYAGVRLLVATFIILPLLPDRTLAPWEALNPYTQLPLTGTVSSRSRTGESRR